MKKYMLNIIKKYIKFITLTLSSMYIVNSAQAGSSIVGYIDYAPSNPLNIPTVSEWGIIALIFMISAIAYRVLQRSSFAKPLVLLLAFATASMMGLHTKWLSDSYAFILGSMISPNGGSVAIWGTGPLYDQEIPNHSGVTQWVTNIRLLYSPHFQTRNPLAGVECRAGVEVQDNQSCSVRIIYVP